MKSLSKILLIGCAFLSCLTCLGQFGVEQPFLLKASAESPIPLDRLMIWHKPESLSGADGSIVSTWIDSSIGGHDAITTAAATGAYITNNVLDGFPILFVTPINSARGFAYRTNDGGTSILRNVSGATVFMVRRLVGSSGLNSTFQFTQGDSVSVSRLSFYKFNASQNFSGSSLDANSETGTPTFTMTDGQWYLITLVADYANAFGEVFTNGVSLVSDNTWVTASNTSDTDSRSATLMKTSSSGAGLLGLCEFILYNKVLTYADRRFVETNYFKAKFPSIPIN